MLLECAECHLPYFDYEDLLKHYAFTHPQLHRENNRMMVKIAKRLLGKQQKTYRCPHCYWPFPHPDLRDSVRTILILPSIVSQGNH
ncbi:hypothetical protein B0H10DRAFT_2023274 [Mycena sp. CBHHK59/15]|nr:hypothetical protein B0H10DRAFT_2023274 [Mycena sp. CBHHK59/15]